MRLLCQHIATRANHEDGEVGKFWQSRYRAIRLLDESAALACSAYVDLNPIRAGLAQTLEQSDFTSVQRRLESLQHDAATIDSSVAADLIESTEEPALSTASVGTESESADRFLSPLSIDERHDPIGPDACANGFRCSEKGFLPMSVADYVLLLDWTARQMVKGKSGSTPVETPSVLARLSISPTAWCKLVSGFGQLFWNVAGRPQTIGATRSRIAQRRYNVPKPTRDLLPAG